MLSNKVQYISRILRPRTCGNYLPNFIAYPSDWHLLPITSCEASDICNGPNLQDGLIIIITRLDQPRLSGLALHHFDQIIHRGKYIYRSV